MQRLTDLERRLAARNAKAELLAMLKEWDNELLRRRAIPLPSEEFMAGVDIPASVTMWHAVPEGRKIGLVMNDGSIATWSEIIATDKAGPAK
ncbi:MAG: hypothetical protein NTU53_23030 [Planctomycetota bacterium]|nr:hypothetical protein [Planctomycetota bacterium]